MPKRKTAPRRIVPRPISHKFTEKQLIGRRVVRGPDWPKQYNSQDRNGKSAGTIKNITGASGWFYVEWDHGSKDAYEFRRGHWDLDILAAEEPEPKPTRKTMKATKKTKPTPEILPGAIVQRLTAKELIGRRVVRGKDWLPLDDKQDNNGKSTGTVVAALDDGGDKILRSKEKVAYLQVRWDHDSETFNYRHGGVFGKYELSILNEGPEVKPMARLTQGKLKHKKKKTVKLAKPEKPEPPPVPPPGLSEAKLEAFHKLPDYLQMTLGQRL